MRCLTFAKEASNHGYVSYFLLRNPDLGVIKLINNNGHFYKNLSSPKKIIHKDQSKLKHSHWLSVSQDDDAIETISILNKIKPDWVVVDHYSLDIRWHKIVRFNFKNLLVIDDLVDRKINATLLLNQNFGISHDSYKPIINENCKTLIGPQYALLRSEFYNWRSFSIKRRSILKFNNILITMGGSDESNITLNVLKKIYKSRLIQNCKLIIIIGVSYLYKEELQTFIAQCGLSIELKVGVDNMAEIMSKSDVCIGAAGSTSWERCCLGLPTLTVGVAENQLNILKNLAKHNLTISSSLDSIEFDLENLYYEFSSVKIKEMINNMISVCDGLGASRVFNHMELQ